MARNPARTVYIGNLDEKVSERVLYEILIQVGRVVDLYIPRDKETSRHKGYAFAEYESEEIAEYAVRLFSGLVRLHNKTLKFAISGQDKPSQNTSTSVAPRTNSPPLPKPHHMHARGMNVARESHSMGNSYRSSGNEHFVSSLYPPVSTSRLASQNNHNSNSYEYSRRVFGAMLNNARDCGGTQPIA